MTKGAIMAFQNDHGFTTVDGLAGPAVWSSLITAVQENKVSTFGYTFANVSLSGQSLNLWHNGKTVTSTAVNTGIPSRPDRPGHVPGLRAPQRDDDERHQPGRQPLQRPGDPVRQLLQRR